MGLADKIRIMRGHLTPEEVTERDAAARRRREAAEREEREQQRDRQERAAASERFVRQTQQEWDTKRRWMQRAAAIATVKLVCHRDLWEFIDRKSFRYKADGATKTVTPLDRGRCSVKLSGPELARVLEEMEKADRFGNPEAERAIAVQVHRTIGTMVDQIDPNQAATAMPQIVIDAGVGRRTGDRPAGAPATRA